MVDIALKDIYQFILQPWIVWKGAPVSLYVVEVGVIKLYIILIGERILSKYSLYYGFLIMTELKYFHMVKDHLHLLFYELFVTLAYFSFES